MVLILNVGENLSVHIKEKLFSIFDNLNENINYILHHD